MHGDVRFEASFAALCRQMYEEAVENAPSDAQRAMVKPVTRSQLVKWDVLIERGKMVVPSNAYALLLGSDLMATKVKCALFKGRDRANFLDRHPIVGASVIDQTKESFTWILSKLNLSATFVNTKRVDIYEIPPDAIREILVNAIVHRTYVDGASSPISVALYDDRLEITSPGGLPRGMTVEKMMEGHSECRNKALAEAFAYIVWGIENATHAVLGCNENLQPIKIGNEELENWLRHQLSENAEFEFATLDYDGKQVGVCAACLSWNRLA